MIHFGYNNFADYDILLKIVEKINKGKVLHETLRNTTKPAKRSTIKMKIDNLLDQIQVLKEKYIKQNKQAESIKSAYVVFRSMEGFERMKEIYRDSAARRCWLYCSCRCRYYSDKLFMKKYLKVSQAPDPSLILWENLGFS
jgi:hypothetical protein